MARNLCSKYKKKILDTTTITRLENLLSKIVYKVAETTVQYIGNKIDDKVVNPYATSITFE